ncbi:MAG: hypothetical protein JW724_08240 [Candidatus Altiarchaeota archaeon]|nr:hypothetical protein [Candidatus Altiarchaeota archaeon]
MKKTLLISLAVLLLGVLVLTGCGTKEKADVTENGEEPDTVFAGSYNVKGPDYNAALSITQTGDCYHLMWTFQNGFLAYGKGILKDGILGAVFGTEEGQDAGTMIFKKDGREGLTGMFVVVGDGKVNSERTKGSLALKPSSHKLEGTYDVKGTNPDGSPYEAVLTLTPQGKSWYAEWNFGDGVIEGEGITIDDLLVTGFGSSENTGVLIYEIKGNKLVGEWIYTNNEFLTSTNPLYKGKETATRR